MSAAYKQRQEGELESAGQAAGSESRDQGVCLHVMHVDYRKAVL